MKNLIIITAILFVSYFAQAQQQEKSYDDIVYLGLPSYLKKPNNEITDFIKNRGGVIHRITHKELYILYIWRNTITVASSQGNDKK